MRFLRRWWSRIRLTKVSVNLPFKLGKAEWAADDVQRRAAWELYVELVTRIAVQPLAAHHGMLREALSSLYALFGITRDVLRRAGPDVGASKSSVGGLAVAVLNKGIRPVLAKWHPELQTWEAQKPPERSPKDHERDWEHEAKLREELEELRKELEEYAKALAKIAGVR